MVRGRDAGWDHCVAVDATKQKVRCNYCHREFSGGVYRMKFHLAQIRKKDVITCSEVPDNVRDHIQRILSTPKREKVRKKLKLDLAVNGQQNSSSSTSGGMNPDNGSNCPFLLVPHILPNEQKQGITDDPQKHPSTNEQERPITDDPQSHSLLQEQEQPIINDPRRHTSSNGQQHPITGGTRRYPSTNEPELPTTNDLQKQKWAFADKKIASFFIHNSIPFSATKSIYYNQMMDAIAQCGSSYKPPTYNQLRSILLEQMKADIDNWCKKFRNEWRETGCTILCDGLSDMGTKSIVVFSVACPKGTMFFKSLDISAHEDDDANYLFELLESIVLEVGVENVVQVITNSTAGYVSAGRQLMAKYNTLFWSPCASYCIEKMLEDISKLEWVVPIFEQARSITRFIYGRSWTISMIRKLTGGKDLIRPRITTFVSNYLSLKAVVIQDKYLKHIFCDSDCLVSIHSKLPDAQAIRFLLDNDQFWQSAVEVISIMEPLVKILRIVDGDMPAMGYMYDGIERAKAAIKTYYNGIKEKYMPIWDVIDRRWNMQPQSSLYAAAAFLNPSIFYNPNSKVDFRMRNGFQEAMMKLATADVDKMEITKEHPVYINAQGALGTDFAILGRTMNSPADWWAVYGYEIPTLQRAATRILGQPCSLHWCRWNRTTFERLHDNSHSIAGHEKFKDLVFVHCNLWLQNICLSLDGKCNKPIVFDKIDVLLPWPSEAEPARPLLEELWLDDLSLECYGSP